MEAVSLPCRKCQSNCSALHTYAPNDCPLQTCEACNRLTELDNRIANLEDLLAKLSQERRDLKTVINRHHDPIIHRFPPEIISQIFTSFVVGHGSKTTVHGWNPLLVLGVVCRGWRAITLSLQELWAEVVIRIPQNMSPLWLEITRVWLSRSGDLPLSLTVKNMDSPEAWHVSRIMASADAFQLIRSHSSRWKALNVISPVAILRALLNGLDVSGVEELSITTDSYSISTEAESEMQPHPQFSPRKLFISIYSLLDNISMRYSNLTSLEAYAIGSNELLHLLQQSIHLQNLKVGTTTRPKRLVGDPYPEPTTQIILDSLTSLDMTMGSVKCTLLWHLTLPSLKSLQYRFHGPAPETDLDALAELLARSSPHLEEFTFICGTSEGSRYDFHPEEHSYHKIPGVTHLVLHIHPTNDVMRRGEKLLRPLGTGRQPLTLPNLRDLNITAPALSPTSWSAICDVFGHHSVTQTGPMEQMNTGRPIEGVSVNLYRDSDRSHLQDGVLIDRTSYFRLRDIRDSGVKIKIIAPDSSRNEKTIEVLDVYRDNY